MDKEHISRDAFFAIYDFLDNDNGPRCLIDELDGFRYYFCSSSWIERATLDVFSNGVYLGEVDSNHRRHGIGVYVFNNGGIYLGEWSQGERDGRGFYYSGGQVFWGEWSAGEKDGRGHIWQVNYESEGIYAKGREKTNMYTEYCKASFRCAHPVISMLGAVSSPRSSPSPIHRKRTSVLAQAT